MSPHALRPYCRPELHVYGAITRMVQGMSGPLPDGMSGMSKLLM